MKTKLKTRTLLALLLIPGFVLIHLSTPLGLNISELFLVAIPFLVIGGYNAGIVLSMCNSKN